MKQTLVFSGLAIIIIAIVLIPQSEATYKDYISVNSRIPGDEEVFHAKVTQNLDFYATVTMEFRYPIDRPHSNYTLSHTLVTGEEDTGFLNGKFSLGGPGADRMRMNVFFYSVKNGSYDVFAYGKKK